MENPKTRAYISTKIYKAPNSSTEQNDSQKVHASMARISSNADSTRRDF